jgi:transposase-like protein
MKTSVPEKKPLPSYSVCFKMRVVNEVENGFLTINEACKLYKIGGNGTIQQWIKKYGINERLERRVHIMTNEEELELIRLRKENKRLQRSLEDSQISNMALESLLELAEEKYGINLKKNFGSKVLEELKKKLNLSGLEKDTE